MALRWEDINFDDCKASINRSYAARYNGELVLHRPKTTRGERNIALPPTVITALKEHKHHQATKKLQLGQVYRDEGLVFANEFGGPIDPNNLRRNLNSTLKKANLPHIRFHDFRHTHATLMLEQGIHPKIVSERLGYSKISITLDIYSHALPNLQSEAAEKLDKALFCDDESNHNHGMIKEEQTVKYACNNAASVISIANIIDGTSTRSLYCVQ